MPLSSVLRSPLRSALRTTAIGEGVGVPAWAAGYNLYDDFDRDDGAIGIAKSGHVWQQNVSNGASRVVAVISGGTLVAPDRPDLPGTGATAAYSVLDGGSGKLITKMRCRASWEPDGANNPNVTLVITKTFNSADATYITSNDAIHISFTSVQCNVGFFNAASPGAVENLTTFNYTDVVKDGTQYDFGFDLDGAGNCTIYGPLGDSAVRSDARFTSYMGRYATWEHNWPVSPATCKTVIRRALALAV